MRLWLRPSFAGWMGALPWFTRRPWRMRHHRAGHAEQRSAHWRQRFVDQVSSRLQLDDTGQARLGVLFDRVQAQRVALRGPGDWRADLEGLVKDHTFDRWHAHDLLNARMQAMREHGPQVIAALADFYDGLQPAQQQKARELLQRWLH
ncbi:Spy/CpxP family protein refolding chaperone [Ideonella sp. BN130291]|uniref:Spy/CpxP family protein refolding chaperone n=1 Tax=Ideonella sp. BN130291 TaxID=3112940 RepID=UPI002E257BB6|nr:Spy/CpxP family protein refolding chaperone [Ideonella sp. BN130291]